MNKKGADVLPFLQEATDLQGTFLFRSLIKVWTFSETRMARETIFLEGSDTADDERGNEKRTALRIRLSHTYTLWTYKDLADSLLEVDNP